MAIIAQMQMTQCINARIEALAYADPAASDICQSKPTLRPILLKGFDSFMYGFIRTGDSLLGVAVPELNLNVSLLLFA